MESQTAQVKFPYEMKKLSNEENEAITNCINGGMITKFMRIGPQNYLMPTAYEKIAEKVYNFKLRKDDIFVLSFPKCGTTWVQELVWLINNDLNYDKAKSTILTLRFPFLEAEGITQVNELTEMNQETKDKFINTLLPLSIGQLNEMSSIRFIKSHMPFSLLPPTLLNDNKVVYIARDPRDVAVSFFYHNKLLKFMAADTEFRTFWKHFKQSDFAWSPFFAHVIEAWEKRNHQNLLFLFYEDLIKDLQSNVQRVAEFFNTSLTDEQLDKLCDHLKFDNFKKNKSVNLESVIQDGTVAKDGAFIRQGKSGGWREYFDDEMTLEAERWITESLRNTDLRFPSF